MAKSKAKTRKKTVARSGTVVRRPGTALTFNHAMIYTSRLPQALEFYRRLGFKVIDDYPGEYARLRSPGGSTTIALHPLDAGQEMNARTEGMRLYFEVRNLDAFCDGLQKKGVTLDRMPEDMPWGWRHAYLHDPDGHEISLYWAGAARLRQTAPRT